MRISEAETSEGGRVGSMRSGTLDQKFLLQGEHGSPNNYLLNVGLTGSGGWGTPRHRHNFDQIRYVLKGKYPASPHKIMGEGAVAYFPESVHYGPQDRPEGLEMMVIQFGGASGSGARGASPGRTTVPSPSASATALPAPVTESRPARAMTKVLPFSRRTTARPRPWSSALATR